MAQERTLGLIKPDAVANNHIGNIVKRVVDEGFTIVALRMLRMSKATAEQFYDVHADKPFYGELTDYMSSGPCVAMVLEADGAIVKWRDLMGATNPEKAAEGTLRKLYAESFTMNATHGSDAPETAAREISFFFATSEIFGR
ncbi:MAG: nucleoside-diphosphate kinase [Deltaproteobacteria bacterium]|nr:nucleoside-diphosphate kinase [bacterium]MCB9476259.1 nucleoside-diphosphate kinase [Deltaproteobacteria bacterium]MCB9489906.1 nucleoside-diphosphate kinase [Deltaproteobacteria bacterium]